MVSWRKRTSYILKENPPKLSGQDIPVVDEYVYLGLLIDRMLDMDAMTKWRLDKAEKARRKMQPAVP